MNNSFKFLAVASLVVLGGCAPRDVSVPDTMQVTATLQSDSEIRDTPAATAFSSLSGVMASPERSSARFGVYAVAPQASLGVRKQARSASLGFSARATATDQPERHTAGVASGAWGLTLNEFSEGEEYVNNDKNHSSPHVAEASLPADSAFIRTAREHLTKSFGTGTSDLSLYTYKVRKFFAAHSSGKATVVDGVNQVSVAFNSTIDALPVIGSGGKIVVEMAADGTVVRHESSVRRRGNLLHVIASDVDLVSPEVAEAKVGARLGARGLDLSTYRLTRREFGYYVKKRAAVQSVLVPHYAFFYEPLPGAVSKLIVEVEPATTDKTVLDLLAADKKADDVRKGPNPLPDTMKRR